MVGNGWREEMEHRHLLDYNLSLISALKSFLISGIIVIFLFFIGLNHALLTNLWCFYSENSVPTTKSQIVPQLSNSSMTMLYFSYIFTWSTPVDVCFWYLFFIIQVFNKNTSWFLMYVKIKSQISYAITRDFTSWVNTYLK